MLTDPAIGPRGGNPHDKLRRAFRSMVVKRRPKPKRIMRALGHASDRHSAEVWKRITREIKSVE